MHAYVEAAKRMFWPIVSSTATTLCAFLPMLFWPGVPGEFMGMLPVTLIFVLSASLVVALIYLPVMGGVSGRMSRLFGNIVGLAARPSAVGGACPAGAARALYDVSGRDAGPEPGLPAASRDLLPMASSARSPWRCALFLVAARFCWPRSPLGGRRGSNSQAAERRSAPGYRRTPFGWVIKFIAGNPMMPLVAIAAVVFWRVLRRLRAVLRRTTPTVSSSLSNPSRSRPSSMSARAATSR